MESSTQLHEAVLFYVINTTSVKVPVDLAQRLIAKQDEDPTLHKLLVETGKDWVARATNIVDILNETANQPWEQSIVIPAATWKVASSRIRLSGRFAHSWWVITFTKIRMPARWPNSLSVTGRAWRDFGLKLLLAIPGTNTAS
jgi:hypothetical protein